MITTNRMVAMFVIVIGSFIFLTRPLMAQTIADSGGNPIWQDVIEVASLSTGERLIVPQKYRLISADIDKLDDILSSTQTALNSGAQVDQTTEVILELPLPDGSFGRFRIKQVSIMEPALAAKYPQINNYRGIGLDDTTAIAAIDRTPLGFHAMILSSKATVYIDPYYRGDIKHYISYNKDDYEATIKNFNEQIRDIFDDSASIHASKVLVSGPVLRTYRLAVAAQGEYTQQLDDGNNSNGNARDDALAGIVTTINRVNGIYEREVAIRLILVGNNNLVIYDDPNTDPYTNNDSSDTTVDENQTTLNNVIGNANYDIGHVFNTGGGGYAPGDVCSNGEKAKAATGRSTPVGDPFDVDYVAHEIGHQFGARHTWNAQGTGSCTSDAHDLPYEPGSGSTIMGYAGICSGQNIQSNSDDYFHAISIEQIINYVTSGTGSSCGNTINTSNTEPTANAGSDYTIPKLTPFVLTGSGSDAEGDTLTFNWEEFDTGAAWTNTTSLPNTDADGKARPIFRSYPSSTDTSRTFPRLNSILNGTNQNIGESLPNIDRKMQFRLTVRDGRGGVNHNDMFVTVEDNVGPFAVTAPNTVLTWVADTASTVTWDVAGTTAAPVSCANVDILLSIDGGNTFLIVLAANTPNDGSQNITVPDRETLAARIKVKCANNIFFDIGDKDFRIRREADLDIAKTDSADPVIAGTEFEYTLLVKNNGPSKAASVQVTDNLPTGFTVISATPGQGTCSISSPVVCQLGEMTKDQQVSIILRVMVGSAEPKGIVSNTAEVISAVVDPNTANNSATEQTEIIRRADLVITSFTIVNPPTTMYVGEETTITLEATVKNDGPSSPVDALLKGTAISLADSTSVANEPTINVPSLAAPRTVRQTYTLNCGEVSYHIFSFAADIQPISPDDVDPNLSNNQATTSLTVECIFRLDLNTVGWHLVSMPVIPQNAQIETLLTEIAGRYAKVLSFETVAQTHVPTLTKFSTLNAMDGTHGYWVYMNQGGTVNVHGQPQPLDTAIALEKGWNLVSYLPQSPMSVADALVSIVGKYDTVLGYDLGATSYYAALPPPLNTLHTMERGKGYWIHMVEAGVLDYSKSLLLVQSAAVESQNQPQVADQMVASNTWINIYSTNSTLNGLPLPVGTTVTAVGKDGRTLGQVTVREVGWYGVLAVYGADGSNAGARGTSIGETIRFLINGKPATIVNGQNPVWTSNGDLFEVNLSLNEEGGSHTIFLPTVQR